MNVPSSQRSLVVALVCLLPTAIFYILGFVAPSSFIRDWVVLFSLPMPTALIWMGFWYWFLTTKYFTGYASRVVLMIQAQGDLRNRLEQVWEADYEGMKEQSGRKTTHRHIATTQLRKEVIPLLLKTKPWWTYAKVEHQAVSNQVARQLFRGWTTDSRAKELEPGHQVNPQAQLGYFAVTITAYGHDQLSLSGKAQPNFGTVEEVETYLQALMALNENYLFGLSVDWAPYFEHRFLSDEEAMMLYPELVKL